MCARREEWHERFHWLIGGHIRGQPKLLRPSQGGDAENLALLRPRQGEQPSWLAGTGLSMLNLE